MELITQSVTQQDWGLMARAWAKSDVEDVLPRLSTRTLLLHPRGYLNVPREESVKLASQILNAEMTLIEGNTSLGDHETGISAIERFLSIDAPTFGHPPTHMARCLQGILSVRELEVLRLLVRGESSREIGDRLGLSIRTVERHVSNIYLKTNTHGRAQATAFAVANGLASPTGLAT
jgi:DNA-binding NarL/FixJ family response regulator